MMAEKMQQKAEDEEEEEEVDNDGRTFGHYQRMFLFELAK